MKRGRKPTPTFLKLVRGNPGKRRLPRNAKNAVTACSMGAPPKELPETGAALWNEIAEQIPAAVATIHDRLAFEILVRSVLKIRQDNKNLTPALAAQIRCLLACFGMTPADRARIAAGVTGADLGGRKENPLAEFGL